MPAASSVTPPLVTYAIRALSLIFSHNCVFRFSCLRLPVSCRIYGRKWRRLGFSRRNWDKREVPCKATVECFLSQFETQPVFPWRLPRRLSQALDSFWQMLLSPRRMELQRLHPLLSWLWCRILGRNRRLLEVFRHNLNN